MEGGDGTAAMCRRVRLEGGAAPNARTLPPTHTTTTTPCGQSPWAYSWLMFWRWLWW